MPSSSSMRLSLCLSFFLYTSALLFANLVNALGDDAGQLKNYIILVRHPPDVDVTSHDDRVNLYASLISNSLTTDDDSQDDIIPSDRIFYTYSEVANGFAARLMEKEVEEISKKEWFVSAIPDRIFKLMTTHTPKFLGLPMRHHGVWNESHMGKGMIIAVLDTGIRPDHPSFDDKGMPPPPRKWRGRCDFKRCNNKLIGARTFVRSMVTNSTATIPPYDVEGHGTHTASTAAGAFVRNAAVFGNAKGVASGMAPRAHLAVYKVCSPDVGCLMTDMTAGMDAAIHDGADVLSLSIGGPSVPFYEDFSAASAFHAIAKGVFVSFAGGNDGPGSRTLSNEAPWVLTVAASTMDRRIVSTVKLGNGLEVDGESLYQPKNLTMEMLPLVFASDSRNPKASYCVNGSFDGTFDVRGKIVVCMRGINGRIEKGGVVRAAGGAGMILMNEPEEGYSTLADAHVLPASHVAYADSTKIMDYIHSTPKPTAMFVFKGTVMHVPSSPAITSFSSRGPSVQSPGILKPDITGPGVNVLAAWPESVETPIWSHKTKNFNVISGTSMSTPHLAGIAALIKEVHPNWSPAAIKSAIMTTSYLTAHDGKLIRDERDLPADYYATGAGHVNPPKAIDPGLVYDITPNEYIGYLCGLQYTDVQLGAIVHRDSSTVNCSALRKISESQLNYPAIVVSLADNLKNPVRIVRTATNVGEAPATYLPVIDVPKGVSVSVKPKILTFKYANQKKSFVLYFKRSGGVPGTVQGQLKWVSQKYVVRSPISINFQ
ncbi:subtilisin-like protease [Typha latifolia]|uniref:subtilisin-like protease n=1 Tax=Typha latifolia TaxID=4733 RepID=UPI003C2BF3D4